MSQKRKGQVWIGIAITIMAFLFYMSSKPYHEQSLVSPLEKLLSHFPFIDTFSHISFLYGGKEISIQANGYIAFIEFFIRKFAHFMSFFILGYAWFKGLKVYIKDRKIVFFLALILCIFYAGFDEFHQSLTPNRTPLLEDVILDSSGAFLAILWSMIFSKITRKHR
ncbi:VanZ family protein [Carnobacteriaceae bacterium zg-ZUI78]|nr:VanZ family protein [Carnobacteriaceae bacterium zg-ZUI78]